jgi:hypothetical protein
MGLLQWIHVLIMCGNSVAWWLWGERVSPLYALEIKRWNEDLVFVVLEYEHSMGKGWWNKDEDVMRIICRLSNDPEITEVRKSKAA